ncbi:hypothetical protein LguiA_001898 [Lonicera macranthoides]
MPSLSHSLSSKMRAFLCSQIHHIAAINIHLHSRLSLFLLPEGNHATLEKSLQLRGTAPIT